MYESLLSALNIRRSEAEPALLLLAFRFALGCTFIIAETVALTLFLSRFDGTLMGFEGVAALPIVYVIGAIMTMAIGLGFLALQRICPTGILIVTILVGVLSVIVGFWYAIRGSDSVALYPALFIATEVAWILFALSAELTMNAVFNVRQAKRTLGVINGGETIAYITGAYTVALLTPLIGVQDILLLGAAFLAVAVVLFFHILRRYAGALKRAVSAPVQRQSVTIYRSRFVWMLILFTILATFALYTTGFQARAAIRLSFDEAGIALCLGVLEGTLGLSRAILSFFVVNRVISRIGLFVSAGLLPVMWIGSAVMVVVAPIDVAFVFILASYSLDRIIRFSFGNATAPLFYHCLPESRKYQVQTFISGVVSPIGAALSGLILLGFGDSLGGGIGDLTLISWGILAAGVITVPVLFFLRKDYLKLLLNLARGKRLNVVEEDRLDRESINLLRDRLHSDDESDVVFAIGLLERVDKPGLLKALPGLISHSTETVRMRAYQVIVSLAENEELSGLRELINLGQESDQALPDAIRALAAITPSDQTVDRISEYIDRGPEPVQAAVAASLARWGGHDGIKKALPMIAGWAKAEDPRIRICAIDVVMEARQHDLWSHLDQLLYDPESSVRLRAIEAAGRLQIPEFYEAALEALEDPNTATAARWILSQMGEAALPAVHHGLSRSEDSPSLRPALMQLASRIDHPDAQALLVNALNGDDVRLRHISLENLFHSESLNLQIPASEQVTWLDRERQFYLELARMAVVVEEKKQSPETELLSAALNDALEDTMLRVLYQLRFGYSREVLRDVHTTWARPASRHVALEILDNVLKNPLRSGAMQLFEQRPTHEKINVLADQADNTDIQSVTMEHVVTTLCAHHAYGDWIRICALHLAQNVMSTDNAAQLAQPFVGSNNVILAEVATLVAGAADDTQRESSQTMLTTMEKLLFLKKVDIFAQVRDEYLSSLARGLTEQAVEEGDVIFKENDVGHSMYVIVSGSVYLEKGGERFATLTSGECVGELAVLDSEPRSASVIAAEDSLLLMIEGQDLFDIMSGQIEIARGLFKVITHRLREARQDAVQASRALEDIRTSAPDAAQSP